MSPTPPRQEKPRAAKLAFVCVALALPLGACFESGPLGAQSSGLEGDGTADLGPEDSSAPDTVAPDSNIPDSTSDSNVPDTTPVDTTVVPDTADTTLAPDTADTTDTTDTTVPPDTLDTLDTTETVDAADTADVPPLRSCLTNADCVGLPGADPCAGPIRCVDYGCRPDPSAAIVCESEDPCVELTCNPTTGGCDSRPSSACSCESPLVLPCGPPATWPTNTQGVRPPFSSLGSCPAGSGDDVRILEFSASGRVRLETVAGISRFWLLDAATCDGAGCLGSHTASLLFNADPTKTYAIAVEENGIGFATMGATCGISAEDRCNNNVDDDGDGLTDCDDRDCDNRDGCVRPPDNEVGLCNNGVDDDSDGKTDCADLDCDSSASCLQACEVPTGTTYCNFAQGLGTGGGKSNSTHYSCNPNPQGGKEVVYKFRPNVSGTVRIGFANSAGLTLHLLRDTGRGCTPRDCIGMATGDLWFEAQANATYYAVIDGPLGVTGSFNIDFDCNPFER